MLGFVWLGNCTYNTLLVAERLSARQLILRRISAIVCIYVCVTLRNAIRNLILYI